MMLGKLPDLLISGKSVHYCSAYCGSLWVVHFQNCIWQPCPQSKMAAITKYKNFFNW